MTDTQTKTEHPAHLAGKRSREAVMARDKEAWLAVFAEDAIVEDPIGPSAFDPGGQGPPRPRRDIRLLGQGDCTDRPSRVQLPRDVSVRQ